MQPDNSSKCHCCSNEPIQISVSQSVNAPGVCPQSGKKGKHVDGATVKAMLAVSLTEVRDTAYFFCKDQDCPVVYFSEDGSQTFTIDQIRARVYQKEPDSDDVLICYCFCHTPGSIRVELTTLGESTVIDAINSGIHAGQCACDIRNPQGSCCLGNVSTFLKEIEQTIDRSNG
jgi:hypothetical protein